MRKIFQQKDNFLKGGPVIIISSPLGFSDCTITFEEIGFPMSLKGCRSYVGHPATRALLEALGAETISGRWEGPEIGECYLAVPLAKNEREGGWTQDQAVQDTADLKAILCQRIA